MAGKITIAIDMADSHGVREIQGIVRSLPNTETVVWSSVPGVLPNSFTPDIIIVDDRGEGSTSSCERFSRLRRAFPQTALFVVSTVTRPEYIVEVMKCGASQFLVNPVNGTILLESVAEVRANLLRSRRNANGMVLSFISSKGGLGSTVIAVNAAVAMANRPEMAVALCDMSLQSGDASVLLDLNAPTTVIDLCRNFHRLDLSFLRSAMSRHTSGLEFLPAPNAPEESEDITAEHVARILDLSRQSYDTVAVDCTSMRVDDRAIEVFKSSDKVFVVTDLSVTSVRNASRLCQLIERVGITPKRLEVVVNRYSKGAALTIEEMEKTLKRRVFWLFPNDFDDIVSSINRGSPVVTGRPHVMFSKNICEFAEKLVNPAADENYRGLRGTFGKAI